MNHPCFDPDVRFSHGRLHLPVAPACNIACAYCDRRSDCVNESRPGVVSRLLTPAEAGAYLRETLAARPEISVAGIAGPGDPLASPEIAFATLETMAGLGVIPCLSTNGLELARHAAELARLGLRHITVTINAVDPDIGARVYLSVRHGGADHAGRDGAALLLERQALGLEAAKRFGMTIKVNTVVIPGLNDRHVPEVARFAASRGVECMNCLAVIPVPGTPVWGVVPPDVDMMAAIRRKAGRFVRQLRHCARCRADAAGLLCEGGGMAAAAYEATCAS